jgi:hypothetical protein
MQLITGPHEVLLRWGRDRKLQGAHIITVTQACDEAGAPILTETGEIMLEKFSMPTPLATAGDDFTAVIGQAITAMAKERDDAVAESVNLTADISKMVEEAKASAVTLKSLRASILELNAKIQELTVVKPVDVVEVQ